MNTEVNKVEGISHNIRFEDDEKMSIHIYNITSDVDVDKLLQLVKSKYDLCFNQKS